MKMLLKWKNILLKVFQKECTEENPAFSWWFRAILGTQREGCGVHVSCMWVWFPQHITLICEKLLILLHRQIVLLLRGCFMHNYLALRHAKCLTFLLEKGTWVLWLFFTPQFLFVYFLLHYNVPGSLKKKKKKSLSFR